MNDEKNKWHRYRYYLYTILSGAGLSLLSVLTSILLLASCLFLVKDSNASAPARVLVINSYHPGYRWSDQMMSGIRETILATAPKTKIYYEHLDSKRFQSPQIADHLSKLIEDKYERIEFDVVLTGDDNALAFLKQHRENLFAGVPAVFCGANDLNPAELDGMAPVTGVNEVSDVRATLDLALTLMPETRRIIIVNDTTTTGRNVDREIQRVAPEFTDRVSFLFLDNLPREDLLYQLSTLNTGDLVLYTFFFRDSENRFYEYDDSAIKICESSPVPVFGLWEFNLGHGIVGGKLVSGYEQGKSAGHKALQIIDGVKIEDIPVKMESPNRFSFDYKMLRKFDIELSRLPAGSLVINRPVSFYQIHKPLIWSGFAAIAALTMMIVFLLGNIARRRKAESHLQRSERRMSQIIDFLPDPTFVIDKENRVIAWNRSMGLLTGVKAKSIVGRGNREYAIPFYGERRLMVVDLVSTWDDDVAMTYKQVKKDGDLIIAETVTPVRKLGNRHFRITAGPLYNEDGSAVGAIESLHDITERRIAETQLAEREILLGLFVENTPAAVAMCDTEMKYIAYSRRWITDYRLPDEDLRGRCHYDVFGSIPKHWKEQHERCFHGEVIEANEEPFYRADGSMDWVRRSIHPWREKTGKIGGLILFTEVITQKKQVEENLQLMERVLNNSPAVLFRWDPSKKWPISFVSDNINQFGYSPQKLLAGDVPYASIIHPDDLARVTQEVDVNSGQGLSAFQQEYRILTATGDTRWVDDRTVIERDDDGNIRHYQGVIFDITDRKQTEKALWKSNRMLRLILDTIPVRVFWKDTDCRYLGCNQPFAEDAGKTGPEEMIGKDDHAFPWGADQAEIYRRDDFAVMASGEPRINFEEPQTTPEGRTIWLQTSKVPIRDSNEKIIGVLGTYQDVTERKRADEELRRLRNYLVNIINSMPSVLVGVDSKGHVTQWNRQAEKVTGLSIEMARSRPLADVFPRLMDKMDRIDAAIKDRRVLKEEKSSYLLNEEMRFEDVTIFPLIANKVEGAVIRVDDITERVRLEEMMIQSEKMLSVGGLAAGMAHEINNPLAGIMQNAAVLQNRLLGDLPANQKAAEDAGTTMAAIRQYIEQRQLENMINNICTSGERAAVIVRNMLSFARKSDHIVSSYDLRAVMDETIVLAQTDYDMKKNYDFKQVRIVRKYATEMTPVPCEKSKIQQVFLNILKNGAEAMAEKTVNRRSPTITLRIKEVDSWGQVEISDNGPGMSEKMRRRIFEPFFTTKAEGKGTGLGLSVSYFIITENHSGKLNVFSKKGKGTRFLIRLPKTQKV